MSKNELIAKIIDGGILRSKNIIAAFEKVDRAVFVPKEAVDEAYEDYPLPIGYGQTISQPSTVAFMLELLDPEEGDRILDVGSGSGWTTALLADLVGPGGKVRGVEIVPELARLGASNLAKYNFPNARIIQATVGVLGLPQEAPFDKILVSAAAGKIPQALIKQLKVGGRFVVPVENSIFKVVKTSKTEVDKKEFPGFVFVPLK